MEKYFAAANSRGGFVSWFDEIFAPEKIDRIFIIKGGSGTGKSTLMKRIAARGVELGCRCEYFYCSSDPSSLDGILLGDDGGRLKYKSVAVIDGTAPHTRDPKLPGAAEEIVNLGEFWQTKALQEHRGEIAQLCQSKSALYSEAYEYLYAAGELERLLREDAVRFILSEKLESAADRLLSQAMHSAKLGRKRGSEAGSPSIRAVSAISTHGIVRFDSYREMPGRLCAVIDVMGTAPFMFDALLKSAKRMGLEVIRAPMPLDPDLTEAIRLPELQLSIISGDESAYDNDVRLINMARFIDREAIEREDRKRRRLLGKCSRELIDGALSKLARIRALQSDLEKIYIAAMDFAAVDEYAAALIGRIF